MDVASYYLVYREVMMVKIEERDESMKGKCFRYSGDGGEHQSSPLQ